jgi:hypothetical protein
MNTSNRTPYDTGERAEPLIWVGRRGDEWRAGTGGTRAAEPDDFGRVDFDDDTKNTIGTVHGVRNADGTYTLHVYLHDFTASVEVISEHGTTLVAPPGAEAPDADVLVEERYFGYAYAPSLSTINETPFVLGSIQEGRELVAAIRDGRAGVTVREYRAGTIVESTTSFVGAQSDDVQMALYRSSTAVPDIGDSHPDVLVKVGPRGGVSYERL